MGKEAEHLAFSRSVEQFSGEALIAYHLNGLRGALMATSDAIVKAIDRQTKAIKDQTTDSGKWQSLQNDILTSGFAEIVKALTLKPPPPAPNLLEVLMSFVVPADQADVRYSLTLGDVTDSEGNTIPDAELSIDISSDNPSSVEVTPEGDGRAGNVHFGSPGNATITANVKDAQGDLLGSGVAGFVVTVGDPAAISGVALAFEGLEETEG